MTALNVTTIDVSHTSGQETNVLLLKNSFGEVVGRIYMTDEQYNNFQQLINEQQQKDEEDEKTGKFRAIRTPIPGDFGH